MFFFFLFKLFPICVVAGFQSNDGSEEDKSDLGEREGKGEVVRCARFAPLTDGRGESEATLLC